MADFLSRLAARALGIAEVSRPVIPPAVALGGRAPAAWTGMAEEDSPHASLDDTREFDTRVERYAPVSAMEPNSPMKPGTSDSVGRRPEMEAGSSDRAPEAAASDVEEAEETLPVSGSGVRRAEHRTALGPIRTEGDAGVEREEQIDTLPAVVRHAAHRRNEVAAEARRPAAMEGVRALRGMRLEAPEGRVDREIFPEEAAGRLVAHQPAHFSERQGAGDSRGGGDQAPAIRITIGRVEVRAIFPAVQAPGASSKPKPALTLEEYAKRGNREGR